MVSIDRWIVDLDSMIQLFLCRINDENSENGWQKDEIDTSGDNLTSYLFLIGCICSKEIELFEKTEKNKSDFSEGIHLTNEMK